MAKLDRVAVCIALSGTLVSNIAYGSITADKCEAAKLKVAGKYEFCRLKEESKVAKIGGTPDFSTCDTLYSLKWGQAETNGGGMCPSNGDQATIQAFIAEHTNALGVALGGGTLPQGVETCEASLMTCTTNLTGCNAGLSTCDSNLNLCNNVLTSTQATLTTCNGNLATCNAGLSTCDSNLNVCDSALTTCNGALATCNSDLGTCPADLGACNADLATCTGATSPPLKTGQTTAFGTGSDGDLQRGVARSYTDNGDGTITDNATGLMWEKKSEDGSIHDLGNTYLWSGASFGDTYVMDGDITSVFLATLNSSAFAGHSDWRIPNINELLTIVDYQRDNPMVGPVFNTNCTPGCTVTTCSCTEPSFYWSSTNYGFSSGNIAWGYQFLQGGEYGALKSGTGYFARAVRGGS
jgi:hypothetical protein